MHCLEFRERAGQWMEGEQVAELAAHLEVCPRCKVLVSELEAIRATAGGLPEVEPPPHLWTNIRAQLESEGRIRQRSWFAWTGEAFFSLSKPAMAGAYFALLFAAAVWIGVQASRGPGAESALGKESPTVVLVRTDAERFMSGATAKIRVQDPIVAASYRENLALVDKYIALCEKTIREQPLNELARAYLYGALQQKAELVASLMERGTVGEE